MYVCVCIKQMVIIEIVQWNLKMLYFLQSMGARTLFMSLQEVDCDEVNLIGNILCK